MENIKVSVNDIEGSGGNEDVESLLSPIGKGNNKKDMNDNNSTNTNDFINEKDLAEIERLIDKGKTIYNDFNTYNKEEFKSLKNDELKMNIKHEQHFNEHLQVKLKYLEKKLYVLQMKYNTYKRWYDRMNIFIIIISTLLSVYEAFRLEIIDIIHENNTQLNITVNMVPIIISSTITCSAAIIKFKKYQEKMENMQYTREKVLSSMSKIEYIKESLWFIINDKQFQETKKKYIDEVYLIYNESISELERHLKYNDPHKFLKQYKELPDKKKQKNSYKYF